MIDWHSHVLPCMDDGSKSVAESIAMIKSQSLQGVDTIIATPHFYANDDSIDSFLKRRKDSYEMLKQELPTDAPRIILGAEVRYYEGISRMEDLELLRIEGTKLILLEMPMTTWSESMVREIIGMAGKSGIRVILAHIERYLNLQKQAVWDRIADSRILMQVNSRFLSSILSKRKAVSLFREGKVHFIGSDCHNMTTRPPKLRDAFDVIEKKLGTEFLNQMNDYGCSKLSIK